jgi:hypothetical protein
MPELGATIDQRRALLQGWIAASVATGELVAVPSNSAAAILLALGNSQLLHAGLDSISRSTWWCSRWNGR